MIHVLAARRHEVGLGYQGPGFSREKQEQGLLSKLSGIFVENFLLIIKSQSYVLGILEQAILQVMCL